MTDQPKPNPQPGAHHDAAPQPPSIPPRRAAIGITLLLLAAVVLAALGKWHRDSADSALAQHTQEMAAPTVTLAAPRPGAPSDMLVLPGNVSAYTDSPIYARTSGYLLHWYHDIGARVHKGDLLAVISTPELDQQLAQAQADLATAQANASNAKTQADRYTGLVDSNAVSRQDTETFVNQAAATSAAVRSAQANVQRLKELQSFEKIYAPFDGVITARTIDIGTLINQGAGNELFHMQAIHTLRVYVNLPQLNSQSLKLGQKIDLTFAEHPGKTYPGTLVRTADAIDPVSRTLLIEIDVDNRAGELLPGSLAEAHIKTPQVGPTYIVPVSALIFRREGLRVGTVTDSSNGPIAHLVPITIGEDDGATAQIVTGLGPQDKVIQDPPDSLIEGQKVHVESAGQGAQPAAGPAVGGK